MRIYLLPDERLLIEINGWGIIEQPDDGRDTVYVTHQCLAASSKEGGRTDLGTPVYGEGVWCISVGRGATCSYCQEPVPEGIQALIYIHSWDR